MTNKIILLLLIIPLNSLCKPMSEIKFSLDACTNMQGEKKQIYSKSDSCLFQDIDKEKELILELESDDLFGKISVHQELFKHSKITVIQLAFEQSRTIPSYKVIFLSSKHDRFIPIKIISSWYPIYFRDTNEDNILDLVIHENPFDVNSGFSEQWPVIIDGNNHLKKIPLYKVKKFLRAHINTLEQQMKNLAQDCKAEVEYTKTDCSYKIDLYNMEVQLRELKHIEKL